MFNDIKHLLSLRSQTFAAIRDFFSTEEFLEVDTPLIVASPDTEPTIEPFQTIWHEPGKSHQAYLIPSPEFLLKRLLAAGSGNIYQLGRSFRNYEPSADKHNPEFMMLEWYRTNADYTDIMNDCENLLRFTISRVKHSNESLTYQGKLINLSLPWERLSVTEVFERYSGIPASTLIDESAFINAVSAKGYSTDNASYDDLFFQVLLNEIEPFLGETRPTFLYDYPVSQAALARKKASDPRFAERFELYIAGIELANAFSELTNWQEQEERLKHQLSVRAAAGQPTWDYDHQFIEALKQGLPPTGGIALGVDRLIMLLADTEDITEILPFPASQLFDAGRL